MILIFSLPELRLQYAEPKTRHLLGLQAANNYLLAELGAAFGDAELLHKIQLLQAGENGETLTYSSDSEDGKTCHSFHLRLVKLLNKPCIEIDYELHDKALDVEPARFCCSMVAREKILETIFYSAVDSLILINSRGIICEFNEAAERVFGYSRSEVVGKNVSMLMPEPHRSQHDAYIARYFNTNIPHIIGIGREVEAQRKNGELFPADLAVGEVRLKDDVLFAGFLRDMSEYKKLESESQSFFKMALDMFAILDLEGNFTTANSRWTNELGYLPSELVGMNIAEMIREKGYSKEKILRFILGKKMLKGFSLDIRSSGGDFRNILWNSFIDMKVGAIYVVARDVTDQQIMLNELEAEKNRAEGASQAKSFFIAKMSHELRTPLNSIIGFSRFLQKNLAGNLLEKDLIFLDRIRRNGDSLLRLINGILEFSRTEAGFVETDIQEVELPALVHEVLDLMSLEADEPDIRFEFDQQSECRKIMSDEVKLTQILQNLIDNAVKFSHGQTVVIRLQTDPSGCPTRLDVIDQGKGIAPEQQDQIFEAFQQVDNDSSRRYGGAGLGLAIARSFADLLGIVIEMQSQPGKGSCFSLVFPRDEDYI